jgi:hypothetical protein
VRGICVEVDVSLVLGDPGSGSRRNIAGFWWVGQELVGGFGFLVIVFVAGGPVGFFIGKAFGVGAGPAGGLIKGCGLIRPGGLTKAAG